MIKQLAFLIISPTPSLKYIAQISSCSLWLNQLNFTVFRMSTLTQSKNRDRDNQRGLEKPFKGHIIGNRNQVLQFMGPQA